MGTKADIVIYAERKLGAEQWELKNEVVEEFTFSWIVHKMESAYGQHEFIFINQVTIEVDVVGMTALKKYLPPRECGS